jgi:hypothetical protein
MRRLLRFVPLGLLTLACALPSGSQTSPRPSGSARCPGGVTTDGDCCVRGCACGASCISCSSMCRQGRGSVSSAQPEGVQPRESVAPDGVQITPSAVASPPPPEPSVDSMLRYMGVVPSDGGTPSAEVQDAGSSELRFMVPRPAPSVAPASEVRSSRPSGAASRCPGGVTTDGDCCVTGCACGASCISCSSRCRR